MKAKPWLVSLLGRLLSSISFPGKWRVVDWVGVAFGLTRLSGIAKPEKTPVTVSLGDRIGRLMWAGCYEPDLVKAMRKWLAPNMVVLDVGANIGFFSILAGDLVGQGGAVYAFEPDPLPFQLLRVNSSRLSWVHPFQTAVSDRSGAGIFYRTPLSSESGWGTLMQTGEPRETMEVPLITLDEWVAQIGLRRVSFLKIDVEGGELRVLRGAAQILTTLRPMVFLEINSECLRRDGVKSDDVERFLKQLSYVLLPGPHEKDRGFYSLMAIPNGLHFVT